MSKKKAKKQKKKRGRILKAKHRLRGKSKDPKRDRMYIAMPPGKRRSHTGKIYYEYRANRADIRRKKGKKKK